MSGSRHKAMEATRLRKENQVRIVNFLIIFIVVFFLKI